MAIRIAVTNGIDSQWQGSETFENAYARLVPFYLPVNSTTNPYYLKPILNTGGVIFPYMPSISEGRNVSYDNVSLTHSNESIFSYARTETVEITLSDCVWTCDTFSNAVYALSVLHFFRTFTLMDFGVGRSGMPPPPMWFSALGNYTLNNIPVLIKSASWSFPNDVDYVSVPDPLSPDWENGILRHGKIDNNYTWLPVEFKISSISLIVQHSPSYWLNYNRDNTMRVGEPGLVEKPEWSKSLIGQNR